MTWIVSMLQLHGKNINIIVNTNTTTTTITTTTIIQNLKTWTVSVLLLHAKNAPQGEKERENMEAVLFFTIILFLLWTMLIIVTWCNKAMIMSSYLAFSGHDAARTALHRHGRRKPWKFVFVFDVLIMKWKWFLCSSPQICIFWNITSERINQWSIAQCRMSIKHIFFTLLLFLSRLQLQFGDLKKIW